MYNNIGETQALKGLFLFLNPFPPLNGLIMARSAFDGYHYAIKPSMGIGLCSEFAI